MNAIDWINQKYHAKREWPVFKAGDTLNVHVKIKEGEKERIQIFTGVVIRIHNNSSGSSFTIRKVSYGVGVERIFPTNSPSIETIELVSVGKIRRAKLYYLRKLSGKKARITSLGRGAELLLKPEGAAVDVLAVESATPVAAS
jgi:large subunit ribosomal protein L19